MCAVCMDEIGREDAIWQCPVCCNSLHDTEECARGWLRLRQSCPTCRAAAWSPPEEPAVSALLRPGQAARRHLTRPLSVDAVGDRAARNRDEFGYPVGLGLQMGVAGTHLQMAQHPAVQASQQQRGLSPVGSVSAPGPRPNIAFGAGAGIQRGASPALMVASDSQSAAARRPPRPSLASIGGAAGRALVAGACAPQSDRMRASGSARSGVRGGRARSVPTSMRTDVVSGFALVGSAIVSGTALHG